MFDTNDCACSGKSLTKLLRPAILALLDRQGTHGYDIVQKIGELPFYADSLPDTSGVYKILKSMETEGLLKAEWEMGEAGPAKRHYTLTKDGRTCLKRWADTLVEYRDQIDALLELLRKK